MKPRRPKDGMSLIEIAEASLHQVRLASADALAAYYIGTLPFALAFLYFWSDMIQGAFAYRHVDTAALGVAVAYIWMKCWQTIYCARIRASLAGSGPGGWNLARVIRIAGTQSIIHATSFFVLPVAFIFMVPFGSTYAFYQNATVFGAVEENRVTDIVKRAWIEARRWPKQNHLVIWLFSPAALMVAAGLMLVLVPITQAANDDWSEAYMSQLVYLYSIAFVVLSPIGAVVAFNVGMAIRLLPSLLHSLLGIDLAVAMGGDMMNPAFFAICVAITSLCLDPVLKAAYTLRCFQGESLHSGEDLRIALRRITGSKGARSGLFVIAAFTAFTCVCGQVHAQGAPAQPVVQANTLDRAISAELEKSAYAWRMPKEIPEDAFKDNFLTHFIHSILKRVRDGLKSVIRFFEWIAEKMFGGRHATLPYSGIGGAWVSMTRLLWYLVFGALLLALGIIVYRIMRQRKAEIAGAVATPVTVTPNLEEESVTADALPEEGWLDLARDLIDRGDLRLAMRALFLASLAALAHRELVRIAKFKSNREYRRELERISHSEPEVPSLFGQGVRALERVWYGEHEIDRASFNEFFGNQERIRALARQR